MGCCGDEPEDEAQPDIPAIERDRKCTDVLFLLVFVGFWIGMFVIGGVGFSRGNVNRLLYGIDYHARLCGEDHSISGADFSSRKQLHYYNPVDSFDEFNIYKLQSVCLDGCPSAFIPYATLLEMVAAGKAGAAAFATWAGSERYQRYLNSSQYFHCEYYSLTDLQLNNPPDDWEVRYFHLLSTEMKIKSLEPGNNGPCQPTFLEYTDFLNYCYPSIPKEMQEFLQGVGAAVSAANETAPPSPPSSDPMSADELKKWVNNMGDIRNYMQEYVMDVYKAWAAILVCGVLGAVVLSMVWLTVLRYFSGFMAWFTLLAVNLLFIAVTLLCASRAGLIGDNAVGSTLDTYDTSGVTDPSQEDKMYFEIATYVFATITGLVLLLSILMIPRIAVAVACLKVASQAISTMPFILFFPVVPFLLEVVLIVWWIAVSIALYSAATVKEDPDGGYTLEWDEQMRYMMAYHLFGLLWTNQFLVGFGLCVIAGAVASYYWCRGDASRMPFSPVHAAMRRTARYHLGSIALGAFIVAVIQFVRVILEYIDRKTKETQRSNSLLKYAMCCIKCCMWYLEKVMKYINRNAYIIVAVKGSSFCMAANRAIQLIIINALRIATVNLIGDTLTWLGKVAVSLGCGFLCFMMTDTAIYTEPDSVWYLSSPLLPILFTILISYFIATCFFQVYDMAVDTIMLSFCEDCEKTDGKPEYAPPLLMSALGQSHADSKSANQIAPKQ
mmetsp:Transcript_25196/g.47612  ORF Transcript_25196/g.47612 Transcript_25196/m.47612 type:complete len:723 (+) Transcript_25196:109-2277(+)|eukprot:CAMPEP_0114250396 /NCGR_PEP_ID=MMETSP0058-20121206/14675_1 /TAXON_ID=36894 /ORGANISM="Pyramimonas parkeae, CCMP726" /LENGTH=722 /DNA_ID=CAMNT_0001364049 /DNA_START=108 /DNA_END=2276 /DNA_ORIENTATION=+